MNKKLIQFTLPTLFFLSISTISFGAGGDTSKSPMPSILVKDMSGKQLDLKTYADSGKTIILSVWATWCGPCKEELSAMSEVYKEWKEKYNVEILAVSIDDARSATKVPATVLGKNWKFPVFSDVNGDIKRILNFQNPPYSIIVDKSGNVVYRHLGYAEGDEDIVEEHLKTLK